MASARPLRLAALAGIGSLAGCSANPRSCDLEASAIVLYATVTDTDEGVEVELKLETGVDVDDSSGTPLSLCTDAGERLEVNGLPAKEQRVLGQIYYVIDSSAPMAIYTIDYVRDEGTISIELEMPPTLELLAPTEGAAIPRAEPIMVSWTPSWPGNTISLALEDRIGSDCLAGLGYSTEVDDQGQATIAANMLEAGKDPASDCKAWISLTRSSVAAYPKELHEGGSIEGYVKRRREFLSSG